MIKACIFDLDGVIVDTAKYHYLAWSQLAEQLGFQFTLEDNERLKGVSRMDSLDILLSIGKISASHEQKKSWAEAKNTAYLKYIDDLNEQEILPGVKDFILSLKKQGILIALGSASKNAVKILTALGLTHLFDAIVDGTKTQNAKPNPEVFLLAAQELKISPEQCIVFEDAFAGVQAAHHAGMRCVGVGHKSQLPEADFIIDGFGNVSSSGLETYLRQQ